MFHLKWVFFLFVGLLTVFLDVFVFFLSLLYLLHSYLMTITPATSFKNEKKSSDERAMLSLYDKSPTKVVTTRSEFDRMICLWKVFI